jgi:WD40 repeat protein
MDIENFISIIIRLINTSIYPIRRIIMEKYFLKSPNDYKLMSQKGVKQYFFLSEQNNSVWDSNLSSDGKVFMSLSSELTSCGYARLYEYDYKTNQAKKLFNVEEVILPQDRAIRASKFHTSISFLTNGKIAMTTHSTDKSPLHPTWLLEAYFNHIWEGFAGSNIVVYDPKTKEASNLGIPAPRESLYGSVYDPKHNCLYSLGFIKGHLYRYSFVTKKVKDLGKVTEGHTFRMVLGPDGNIFGSSKSGYLFKIDTDNEKVIDMDYRVPYFSYGEDYTFGDSFGNIAAGRIGPDGRIYFSIMYGPNIIALDTKTGKIEDMGHYLPTPRYAATENRNGIFGFDFDSKGVMWYAVSSISDGSDKPQPAQPSSLFKWDIINGKRPEWTGVVGTSKRLPVMISDMFITKDDTIIMVDTNHGEDCTSITTVNLKEFEPTIADMKKVKIEDIMFDVTNEATYGYSDPFDKNSAFIENNPYRFDGKLKKAFRIWRALAPNNIEDSPVSGIVWDADNVLHGICGVDKKFCFQIKENTLTFIKPLEELDNDYIKWLKQSVEPKSCTSMLKLPHYPGRQYKAVSTVSVELEDGRFLIGTLDGLLAVVSDDSIYSLGMVGCNGPIRALTATPDKSVVYGVAGDEEDLGMVFKYDNKNGLQLKGHIKHTSSKGEQGTIVCNYLSCCSISKDGKYLAIASKDRLGTVAIYSL